MKAEKWLLVCAILLSILLFTINGCGDGGDDSNHLGINFDNVALWCTHDGKVLCKGGNDGT